MTYEYICTACSHGWEAEQPISAPPLRVCPQCGAETAKRQVSGGAGFILRGGGWYADLYGSAKAGKKEDSGGDSKSESKSESKKDDAKSSTESKPSAPAAETKTETKAQPSTSGAKSSATTGS
jgi:putative FmdB family regulatory protein